MREMNPEKAAFQIRRAYGALAGRHTDYYMSVVALRDMVDLTHDEITAGVRHLMATDAKFWIIPESNQKVLKPEERECAIWIGNQPKHWLTWHQ